MENRAGHAQRLFAFGLLLVLLLFLPVLIALIEQVTHSFSRAASVAPNIVVDISKAEGTFPAAHRGLSQGGEEQGRMFARIIPKLRDLGVRYIRIDHIYDSYDVVKKADNRIVLDFSKLDATVGDIVASGALPFFSLSYMPPAISSDGTILGAPGNWDAWAGIVRATVQHYSGRGLFNLSGVYYEVWNEPDLFGRFTMGGEKDYGKLYLYAARGATSASDTNPFLFGGPAITHPDATWIGNFLQFISQTNTRLDFLSYHRYGPDPSLYEQDISVVRGVTKRFPSFASIPLVLSEWGPDSEINPIYDQESSAAFTLVTIRRIVDKMALLMPFGVKDGPSPNGQALWGRWGILTHDAFGAKPKPRYEALRLLSALNGQRVKVTGEGTYVEAFAAVENNRVRVLVAYYDPQNPVDQLVPITIKGLINGTYSYQERNLQKEVASLQDTVVGGELKKTLLLAPFGIRLVQLSPIALNPTELISTASVPPESTPTKTQSGSTFTTGRSGLEGDSALVLDGKEGKLEFFPPGFSLNGGTIDFSIKPNFAINDSATLTIFTLPLQNATSAKREFAAKKQIVGFGPRLVLGIFEDDIPVETVSASIGNWKSDEWHDVSFSYGLSGLSLTIDGTVVDERKKPFGLSLGTVLSFENTGSAIDNVKITDDTSILTNRKFDGCREN